MRIGLKVGESYTRRSLLTAMMVKSSNDIAQALARDNAGSVAAFAAKMNAVPRQLGSAELPLHQSARPALAPTDEDPTARLAIWPSLPRPAISSGHPQDR